MAILLNLLAILFGFLAYVYSGAPKRFVVFSLMAVGLFVWSMGLYPKDKFRGDEDCTRYSHFAESC